MMKVVTLQRAAVVLSFGFGLAEATITNQKECETKGGEWNAKASQLCTLEQGPSSARVITDDWTSNEFAALFGLAMIGSVCLLLVIKRLPLRDTAFYLPRKVRGWCEHCTPRHVSELFFGRKQGGATVAPAP